MDYSSFSRIEDKYGQLGIRTRLDHPKLIDSLGEAIRFQMQFADDMSMVLRDICDAGTTVGRKTAISHTLFSRGSQLIYMAHLSALHGVIPASHSLSRTVYESILTQYYVGLYDDDMSGYIAERDPAYEGKQKYDHNFFKQALYEGEALGRISEFYREINGYVHPNSLGQTDLEYDRGASGHALSFLLGLSLFNVLSYAQLYAHLEEHLAKVRDAVEPFIRETMMNSDYVTLSMCPNKKKR